MYSESFGGMWFILKIACLYGFFASALQSGETARARIINGDPIRISKRPFMVSLHHRNNGFFCGGSIIGRDWVLTAFHCLPKGLNAREFFVRAGSTYRTEGGSIHWISNAVYFHDTGVNSEGIPKHDILLLRVKRKFQLSRSIKPISLPDENDEIPSKLWVSGWGLTGTQDSSKFPEKLQMAAVDVIGYEKCIAGASWYPKAVSNETHLCCYDPENDACSGDSGGPLADREAIYGIVSFGDGCASAPGVYVKVVYYVQWIKKVLRTYRRIKL